MSETAIPSEPALGPDEHPISFRAAVMAWLRVAALSFGGPAGQIAVMHRILVDEKKWISENRFLHALNYCMVLPGPEAQQLAIYIGWLLHGTKGGLVAGWLFVLPGFVSILLLSLLYAGFQDVTVVQALFFGIKAAVLAIVIQAVIKIGKRALKNATLWTVAAAAFVSIFFLELPFPLVIISAGVIGLLGSWLAPTRFSVLGGHAASSEQARTVDTLLQNRHGHHADASWRRALKVVCVWLPLWLFPTVGLMLALGMDNVFTQMALFFSKLAVVTFGGAYAVLAYMAQEAVQHHGWLEAGEMLDGLGMAETTPGPLIQVVQFVGFLGAFREPGSLDPFLAGVLASVLVTWVTFVPCFLWIFLGAPYIEKLRGNRAVSAALSAITAAVVGVMLNLALWLAIHLAFGEVEKVRALGLSLLLPNLATIQVASVLITLMAFVAMLRFRLGIFPVLGGSAVLGAAYYLLVNTSML
jgi:chromate transporter